ncbi:hypothetical protein A9K55_005727 [Cordyceps militaris]|uniref:Protein kinase domain-containing protein n=1 Tax=Cordyceps militaris TaxID=73501 RepID=A0A2H4SA16_CORMI|nr:hypothetical protein A9K55_005727 [Cordyceps militaris]
MERSQPPASAYCENQVLSLNIESSHGFLSSSLRYRSFIATYSHGRSKVQLQVRALQQPWTLSCGMVAVVVDGAEEAALRADNKIPPWTTDIEDSYVNFLQSDQAASLFDQMTNDEYFKFGKDKWHDYESEALLSKELLAAYNAETAAYEALVGHQGKIVPRLLGKVTFDLPPETPVPSNMLDHIQVKGILLQYLPGFTLSELDQHVPQPDWQGVIDEAVRITRTLGDLNILNYDVRPSNFMVVPVVNNEYQVFIIDFGWCRLRQAHESDAEWGRAKWQRDEEGAVGLVMQHRLREKGYEYKFEHSLRYLEWAPGEDD